jgi:DNA polymerase I-like protein with 3'-5' exonuclease and polymerase domains
MSLVVIPPGAPKHTITIDFETYYDDEYTLTKMPMAQYVYNRRFEIIGVGYKLDDDDTVWVTGREVKGALTALPWEDSLFVAHNAHFDALVLGRHFNLVAAKYFCTAMAARPVVATKLGSVSLKKVAEHFGLGQKGDEVHKAKGKRLHDFTAEQLATYGEYCKNDVSLTYLVYNLLLAWFEENNKNVA